jgi:hypothetical protein
MFAAITKVQWIRTRLAALFTVVVAFALPIASVQGLRTAAHDYTMQPSMLVAEMQTFGIMYMILAAGIGLAFALLAWNPDQRGRHVYALSIPVSRPRYAAMRFGAGSIFLLAPAIAMLIGCLIALGVVVVPVGLRGYPVALTLRFFLAAFVAYALAFAMSSLSQRAAARVLGGFAVLIVFGIVLNAMGSNHDLLDKLGTGLFAQPGLLAIFTGRWMLIDV